MVSNAKQPYVSQQSLIFVSDANQQSVIVLAKSSL